MFKMTNFNWGTRVAVVCLLAAALVGQLAWTPSDAWAQGPTPPGGGAVGPITSAMINLAQNVMTILMVAASILLTIGIATGGVQGLFATTVGSPYALASSWFKIISIVILAVIAFMSPVISRAVITTVAGLVGNGGIPVFGQ